MYCLMEYAQNFTKDQYTKFSRLTSGAITEGAKIFYYLTWRRALSKPKTTIKQRKSALFRGTCPKICSISIYQSLLIASGVIRERAKFVLKLLFLTGRRILISTEYFKTEKNYENVLNLKLCTLIGTARPKIWER